MSNYLDRFYYDSDGKPLPWCDKPGCGCLEHPPGARDGTTGTYRSDGIAPRSRGGFYRR